MIPDLRLYDKSGQPITYERWSELRFGDDVYFHVAATAVGALTVSTVWLGLDHRYVGNGPPLIFESMVFFAGWEAFVTPAGVESVRYSTETEALAGHALIVESLKQQLAEIVGKKGPEQCGK